MRENIAAMERQRDDTHVKKGPWTAEEDGVLMNYVTRYGPRGWSSIRNMGLLQRTGKSCRLRWVNKLRPNLKSGCKFTVEEERMVIDLQAQFGNKWAKIATYLPGRTDNDVKNFWSARRKRLERILQTPQQILQKKEEKNSVLDPSLPIPQEPEPEFFGFVMKSCVGSNMSSEEDRTQDLGDSELPSSEATSDYPLFPVLLPFEDLNPESSDRSFEEMFQEVAESEQNLPIKVPFDEAEKKEERGKPEIPDTVFEEFPADIFDCLEPLSSSFNW